MVIRNSCRILLLTPIPLCLPPLVTSLFGAGTPFSEPNSRSRLGRNPVLALFGSEPPCRPKSPCMRAAPPKPPKPTSEPFVFLLSYRCPSVAGLTPQFVPNVQASPFAPLARIHQLRSVTHHFEMSAVIRVG